jgi:hypothetical protein
MNWQPLTARHGAPLRLYLAVKYGFKSLKPIFDSWPLFLTVDMRFSPGFSGVGPRAGKT